jgi:AhpD family alkylhydroperoxidase
MTPRIDVSKYLGSTGVKALMGLQKEVDDSGLEHSMIELVKIRASQLNGCAYCIDMHTKEARAAGETEQRIYGLSAWRETPFYSDRERAALEWTESLTLIGSTHVPDETFESVRKHFTEAELVSLTFAVIAINSWNRIAVSYRAVPGSYRVRSAAAATA